MFHSHSHDNHSHDDHDHDHDDGHGHHDHEPEEGTPAARRLRVGLRFATAGLIVAAAVFASASVTVGAGQATVITRFGDLSRVLVRPGLAWKLPTPIESVIPVDLRLRTTSTGMQDVGTKDGLRILVQAYAAWQVPPEPARIRQFLRAVRNDPDEAARQIRSLVGSALQVTASSFELADLVDTDPKRQCLPEFEGKLRDQVEAQLLDVYGLRVLQVGIERLSLPDATLVATVARMRAERETVAAARPAAGRRAAAGLRAEAARGGRRARPGPRPPAGPPAAERRAEAARDARIAVAGARTQAADIEATSRREAAAIQAGAYQADPGLYALLRSMDTLGSVVGPNTRMVLRTDAAPFNMLIAGPAASLPEAPAARTAGANP